MALAGRGVRLSRPGIAGILGRSAVALRRRVVVAAPWRVRRDLAAAGLLGRLLTLGGVLVRVLCSRRRAVVAGVRRAVARVDLRLATLIAALAAIGGGLAAPARLPL